MQDALEYNDDHIVAVVNKDNYLHLISRRTKEEFYKFPNLSEDDNPIQIKLLPGYDKDLFPYALLRDNECLSLVDLQNMCTATLIRSKYQVGT